MSGPLDGVRVVDFSVMISGPLAGMLLADLGASVTKVETPGFGDVMRYLGSTRGGVSGFFVNTNRGKQSIALNLKDAAGREIAHRLVSQADVLIQNFRPGAAQRMGIGAAEMCDLNPGLIYVSISGFGDSGPYSNKRVYDNVIQGYSGMAGVQTNAAGDPTLLRNLVCDKVTAYTVSNAVTAALFARERARATGDSSDSGGGATGGGQQIDVSMLDSAVSFLWPDAAMDACMLEPDTRRAPTLGSYYQATPLVDGSIAMTMVSDSEFAGFFNAIGKPHLAVDPRFTSAGARNDNMAALVGELAGALDGVNVADAIERLNANDVPCAPLLTIDQVPHDPQVIHNGLLVDVAHPVAGMVRQPRVAPLFSRTPATIGAPAPMLGQHSAEVLHDAGYTSEEVDQFFAVGAVA